MTLFRAMVEALFRVLFTFECRGQEHLPDSGPAVVAANHPSYLDPILLSLEAPRPIRFMAWDALFRVPLLGPLLRAFGAFPVDIRKGQGRKAYDRAKALVVEGEIVGIFPEGHRSEAGWMEPSLKEGAARLSFETGAPLVPASIAGAFRAWPHFRSLPMPAHIQVRFHEPIDPAAYRSLGEEEGVPALLAELRTRVERTLLPGVKADFRLNVLYRMPAPWPRLYESAPPLALALWIFWKTRAFASVAPVYAYILYLLLDHFAIPQRRIVKWFRNASPLVFFLGFAPAALRSLGIPPVPAGEALSVLILGALFPYLYEHGQTTLGFIRGMVFAACFEAVALRLAPTGLGPHLALPLFAAAFAWERRTVFWPYSAPILAAYALVVPWRLGGRTELLPHATAALLAWIFVKVFPYRKPSDAVAAPEEQTLSLKL